MTKYKIVTMLDKLFIACTIFLISYAWINFYIRNLWTTFILSLLLTASVCFILFFFSDKKVTKQASKKASEEKINNSFLFFKLLTREEKIKLVSSIFKDNELKIKSNNLFIKINDKNCQIIFATHFDSLNQKNLIDLLDEQAFDADKYIVICCENATTNKNLYTNKEIEIIDKTKLYDLMEENDCLIKGENINSKIDKSNFKDLLSMVFARSKAKSYFFCGLILIFSSIILPYHFYYLVFGSMLLLFSIICKVWKRRKA